MPLAPDPQSRFAYRFDGVLKRRVAIARRRRYWDRLANVVLRGGPLGVVADNLRIERDARVFGDLPRANSGDGRQAMKHPRLRDVSAEARDLGRAASVDPGPDIAASRAQTCCSGTTISLICSMNP